MELLDRYNALRDEVYSYFGYINGWRVIPLSDAREYFWKLHGKENCGTVKFASTKEELESESGYYYEEHIYTTRTLPKWVYRGAEYTMVVVDTKTDGNQFLQVFSNAKEIGGSLSKLNKQKAKRTHAQKMSNEWQKRFYEMREKRNKIEVELMQLKSAHIKIVGQFKSLNQRLKKCREDNQRSE